MNREHRLAAHVSPTSTNESLSNDADQRVPALMTYGQRMQMFQDEVVLIVLCANDGHDGNAFRLGHDLLLEEPSAVHQ
jgi:hypothetical protein